MSLAIDFRPPSSGLGDYPEKDLRGHEYGWYYRQALSRIQTALSPESMAKTIPNYNATEGYEIKGMVWFQGWNDLFGGKWREYERNLRNLIRDIRIDLDTPQMPVVVGELGQHGIAYEGSRQSSIIKASTIRMAQFSVCNSDEFANNTRFVFTSQYVDDSLRDLYQGMYHYYGRADTFVYIGRAFGYAMLELLQAT